MGEARPSSGRLARRCCRGADLPSAAAQRIQPAAKRDDCVARAGHVQVGPGTPRPTQPPHLGRGKHAVAVEAADDPEVLPERGAAVQRSRDKEGRVREPLRAVMRGIEDVGVGERGGVVAAAGANEQLPECGSDAAAARGGEGRQGRKG